jgi:DnaK suppressor protein
MSQVSSTDRLDAIVIDRLRSVLEQERTALLATLRPAVAVGDGDDGTSNDTGERDALRYQEGLTAAVATMTRAALAEIDSALERVADGSYGACLGCGSAIPVERLAAMPAASHCVACQQRRE